MESDKPTTGSLVWHLAMRWRAEVDRAVAPFDLTHAQYSALASLHAMAEQRGSPTQRELADYMRIQPIYISKLVRSLEAAGHVTRRPDASDSRAIRLSLTEKGRAAILAARDVVRLLDDRLTEPLGGSAGARTQDLVAVLRLLISHHDGLGERS